MAPELSVLYNYLHSSKAILVEKLKTVDEDLFQLISFTKIGEWRPKKHKVSLEMVTLFQDFLKMHHICDQMMEKLAKILGKPRSKRETTNKSDQNLFGLPENSETSTKIQSREDWEQDQEISTSDAESCSSTSTLVPEKFSDEIVEERRLCTDILVLEKPSVKSLVKNQNQDGALVHPDVDKRDLGKNTVHNFSNLLPDSFQSRSEGTKESQTLLINALASENPSTENGDNSSDSDGNQCQASTLAHPNLEKRDLGKKMVYNFTLPPSSTAEGAKPIQKLATNNFTKNVPPNSRNQTQNTAILDVPNRTFHNFSRRSSALELPYHRQNHIYFDRNRGKNNLQYISKPSPDYSTINLRFDRIKEAQKLLIDENLKTTLTWVQQPPHPKSEIKKEKENVIAEIEDNILIVGDTCTVCHFESLLEFYVRNEVELFNMFDEQFNEDMNKQTFVVNRFKTKLEAQKGLGRYCCGFLEARRKWYRIEVLDWMIGEPDYVSVQFVDHGELFSWSFTKLKPLNEVYSKVPKLAIKCHLAGITDDCCYQQDINKRFKEISATARFKTIFVYKKRDSYGVDMVNADQEKGYTLGQILTRNNSELEVELSDIEEQESDEGFFNLNFPEIEIYIRITGYITTCHFYAHILHGDEDVLTETMARVATYEPLQEAPKPGDIVLVEWEFQWYRVKCLQCCDTEVVVFSLDFGFKLRKKTAELRKIPKDILVIPFQAVECMLANCREKKDACQVTSKYFFDKILSMNCFHGFVVERSEVLKLQLWDSDNRDLGDVLIKCGLGEECP